MTVPNFYFQETEQKSIIHVTSRHIYSDIEKVSNFNIHTKIELDEIVLTEPEKLEMQPEEKLVYAVVPLSGRFETLEKFIENWKQNLSVKLHLTFSVIDNVKRRLLKVKNFLTELQKNFPTRINFIILEEPFSRGKSLERRSDYKWNTKCH